MHQHTNNTPSTHYMYQHTNNTPSTRYMHQHTNNTPSTQYMHQHTNNTPSTQYMYQHTNTYTHPSSDRVCSKLVRDSDLFVESSVMASATHTTTFASENDIHVIVCDTLCDVTRTFDRLKQLLALALVARSCSSARLHDGWRR